MFGDVVKHVRSMLMQDYGLDILWYVSLPSFSMDSCLHYTDVVLELLKDYEMHQIIQDGIRGGVIHIGSPQEMSANNEDGPPNLMILKKLLVTFTFFILTLYTQV